MEIGELERAFPDLSDLDGRRERLQWDREDHRVHLPPEDLLERDAVLRRAIARETSFPPR